MADEAVNEYFGSKLVWLTGASSGIGEALALELATCDTKLVLSARDQTALSRVADACVAAGARADNVMVLPLDVVDAAAMPAAVAEVTARFGDIDVLINNAGLGQRSFCTDTELDVYRTVFDVNVMGPIALTKAVLPGMIDRRAGHIVVTSSLAGKFGVPLRTGYCMAKHAVMGFFDALRAEIAYFDVAVSTIVSGVVRTNVVANALQGDGSPIGQAEGEMHEGMEAGESAKGILEQLAKRVDEVEVAGEQELAMLAAKRNDATALFRAIEGMAEQLHAGAS